MELKVRCIKAAAPKYHGKKSMLTAADHQDAADRANASAEEKWRSFSSLRGDSIGQTEKQDQDNKQPPDFTPLVVIIGLTMFGLAM